MPERVKKLRDFFGIPRRDDFTSLSTFIQSPTMTWLIILVFAILITFITTVSFQRVPKGLEEGMIATRDIKADRNYEIIDEEMTAKLKQDAAGTVLPVYNFDEGVSKNVSGRIHEAFAETRDRPQQAGDLRELFSSKLGIDVTPDQFGALAKDGFSQRSEQMLSQIVTSRMMQPIAAEKGTLGAEKQNGINLRHVKPEGEEVAIVGETAISDPSVIPSTADIREKLAKLTIPRDRFKTKELPGAILSIAQALIGPNVSFDSMETDKRKSETISGVQNVTFKIKAGEMIVRNGGRLDARQIKILNGIMLETAHGTYPAQFAGTVLFIVLLIIVIYYFAEKYIRRFHPARRDYLLMGILAIGHVVVMRLGFAMVPVLHDSLLFDVPTSALYYVVPAAGSAMLLRMFLHAEDSFLFAVFMTILSGLFSEADLQYVAFCLIINVAGISSIANADKRSTIIKAGAVTGLVGSIALLGIKLAGIAMFAGQGGAVDIFWHMLCAFFGGFFSAALLLVAAPLIESVMDYTTDIKLLELANLNHPLLRELIVRAPGTYHHSHLVGILSEEAAEAIGANPLLVRVGAYYHDIGKIRKPQYFVENSKEGEDRHGKLLPHMSSLIISSHVKEGIEMAEESRLPRSIIDMIPQHHGTRAISFFFEKAKAQATGDEEINEADFHYPGPKPQSREAAILMLADVSEAAVRSLKEKSTTRIQQTVQRVINDCFAEEQLDECELTLKDLNDIARAFSHILFGIYHQRIEYPKETRQEPEVSVVGEETLIEDDPAKSPPKPQSAARGRKAGV